MNRYNPKQLEPKWQQIWEETKLYKASEDPARPKSYVIDMFPYPSGAGLHVGHVRNFSISDTYALFQRQRGFNVLRTIGFDAFGLPTENYAIQTGKSPQEATAKQVEVFKGQLKKLGMSYDWDRELLTSDPAYYRWTQWIFLQLFKHGLAYQKENPQWWCEHDQTVLADEQVINGRCWRCDNPVIKKLLKQWFFKITEYADQLLEGLDDLDWPEKIKTQQRNWIGRSVGAEIDFAIVDSSEKITVFTTRHDTQYGVTYLVLAPEHPLVAKITTKDQRPKVDEFIAKAMTKSELERMEEKENKPGVFTGAFAINPANDEKIPVWVADYVLMNYGTGAVMGVPAHDDRDYDFAKLHKLEIREVLKTDTESDFHSEGEVINSGPYTGMRSEAMREKILADFVKRGVAREKVNYKMRDWLISRQRYWGAPIPIIHCEDCGAVAVPEDQLPVELPQVDSYQPSGDGRSALARAEEWLHVDCPKCGKPAQRETDTMDGYACSSWYFLRYTDPHNSKAAWDKAKADYWMPVDIYVGGDHAVAHLLYARFWTMFFNDQGLLSVKEPFKGLRYNGYILAPDGNKMSKSKGNVVNPNDLIDQGYGADALRMYELFIGPYEQNVNWNPTGIDGTKRFLNRVWALVFDHQQAHQAADAATGTEAALETAVASAVHRAIKKVSGDLLNFGFNTAIAAMMECVNELYRLKAQLPLDNPAWHENLKLLVQILAPFAPHITEELWQALGGEGSVHVSAWPQHNPALVVSELIPIVLQVNGKLRAQLEFAPEASEDEITKAAKANENVARYLQGKQLVKTIYVPGKLINFVVK